MKRRILPFALVVVSLLVYVGCSDENLVELDSTPYVLDFGTFPTPNLPADNALTQQGVLLGKMLFYETRLSKDGSQSCAGCHLQEDGFTDIRQFSIGVEKLPGKRQAMTIFNMAWHTNGFFWDGRAPLLRDQSLLPIQDPLEMNETLENAISKLSADQMYLDQFTRAFGSDVITSEKMSLAMEQFMLSIISMNSKYDRYLAGTDSLTASEERGRELFFKEYNEFIPAESGADCAHCHGGLNFENDQFMNNGLDMTADIADSGRIKVTGDAADFGKFKVSSLRNIEISGPFMHDGRFTTLRQVIDHYNGDIQPSSTLDPALDATRNTGLRLTEQDKTDLENFLLTLTDQTFLSNSEYASPF